MSAGKPDPAKSVGSDAADDEIRREFAEYTSAVAKAFAGAMEERLAGAVTRTSLQTTTMLEQTSNETAKQVAAHAKLRAEADSQTKNFLELYSREAQQRVEFLTRVPEETKTAAKDAIEECEREIVRHIHAAKAHVDERLSALETRQRTQNRNFNIAVSVIVGAEIVVLIAVAALWLLGRGHG